MTKPVRRLKCPRCATIALVPEGQKPSCASCGYGRSESTGRPDAGAKTERRGAPNRSGAAETRIDNQSSPLIACSDCGHTISPRAKACPECGAPGPLTTPSIPESAPPKQKHYPAPTSGFGGPAAGVDCPACGSPHTERITAGNKVAWGVLAGPLAIGHLGKTFRCNSCKYRW